MANTQISAQEMEELTTHFNKTPEEISEAVQLLFDGTIEQDFKTLHSLMRTRKKKYQFASEFLNDPVKRLAFDILSYYGKGEDK